MTSELSVACVLCQGRISVLGGNLEKLKRHLELEHATFGDMDMLIAVGFLEPGEREVILEKVVPRIKRILDSAKLASRRPSLDNTLEIEKRVLELENDNAFSPPSKVMRLSSPILTIDNEIDYGNGAIMAVNDISTVEEGKVKCDICGKLMRARNLKIHKNAVHKKEENKNIIIETDVESLLRDDLDYEDNILLVSLEEDSKRRRSGVTVQCEFCCKEISKGNINRHKKSCETKKTNTDNLFPEDITKKIIVGDIAESILPEEVNDKSLKCSICDKTMLKSSMNKHVRIMHLDKYLEPDVKLSNEESSNTENNEYEESVSEIESIINRIQTSQNDSKSEDDNVVEANPESDKLKVFKCDNCDNAYSSRGNLERHWRQKHL